MADSWLARRLGWLPCNHVEALQSAALGAVLEQAPRSLRMAPEAARQMMSTLHQQEQLKEQRQQQLRAAKKPLLGALFKKKPAQKEALSAASSSSSPPESKTRPGLLSPRKKSAAPPVKRGKEIEISGPIAFVHKTHLTGEQVRSSEALLEGAKQMGLTETTAQKIIFGESRPKSVKTAGEIPAEFVKPPEKADDNGKAEKADKPVEQLEARPRVFSKQLPAEPVDDEEEDGNDEETMRSRATTEQLDELRDLQLLAAGAAADLARLELLATEMPRCGAFAVCCVVLRVLSDWWRVIREEEEEEGVTNEVDQLARLASGLQLPPEEEEEEEEEEENNVEEKNSNEEKNNVEENNSNEEKNNNNEEERGGKDEAGDLARLLEAAEQSLLLETLDLLELGIGELQVPRRATLKYPAKPPPPPPTI